METYTATGPVSVNANLTYAQLILKTATGTDVTVEINSDSGQEETPKVDVSFADDVLTIKQRDGQAEQDGSMLGLIKSRIVSSVSNKDSVRVEITVPEQSSLTSKIGAGEVEAAGPLAKAHVKSGAGDISIEHSESLDISLGAGDVTVGTVAQGKIATGGGEIAVSNCGDVEVKTGAGAVTVDRCEGTQQIKAGVGDINVKTAVAGSLRCSAGVGSVTVGVAEGTACHLDLRPGMGSATSELMPSDEPGEGEQALELTVKTGPGNIRVHRTADHSQAAE